MWTTGESRIRVGDVKDWRVKSMCRGCGRWEGLGYVLLMWTISGTKTLKGDVRDMRVVGRLAREHGQWMMCI